MRRLKESNEFNNLTLEMITKLYDEGLGNYVYIKHVGPYENEESILDAIEGAEYGFDGYAYGYEYYKDEGYDSEDEALEAYLKDNKVFVFGTDIGQTGCNWMDETSMSNYLSDVYVDLDVVESAKPEDKKIFRKLGIIGPKKKSVRKSLKESEDEFNNVTVEMIEKLYAEDLEEYVHIRDIGPFGGGEATLEAIEGGTYPDYGNAHGYEGYEEEGYETEDEALEDFLRKNTVYIFSEDFGQSSCNWVDGNQLREYLADVYIDLYEVKRASPEAKKVFRSLGIGVSEKQSKILEYTVQIKIETYEDWEDDYDSFEDYVDSVASDAQNALDKIAYYHEDEGVTVHIEQQ